MCLCTGIINRGPLFSVIYYLTIVYDIFSCPHFSNTFVSKSRTTKGSEEGRSTRQRYLKEFQGGSLSSPAMQERFPMIPYSHMSYAGFAAPQHYICNWWKFKAFNILVSLLGRHEAEVSELTSVSGHPCLSCQSVLICVTQPVRKIPPNNTLSWETGDSGHDVIRKGICMRYRRCLTPWKEIIHERASLFEAWEMTPGTSETAWAGFLCVA